jgi:hypothetical protein
MFTIKVVSLISSLKYCFTAGEGDMKDTTIRMGNSWIMIRNMRIFMQFSVGFDLQFYLYVLWIVICYFDHQVVWSFSI